MASYWRLLSKAITLKSIRAPTEPLEACPLPLYSPRENILWSRHDVATRYDNVSMSDLPAGQELRGTGQCMCLSLAEGKSRSEGGTRANSVLSSVRVLCPRQTLESEKDSGWEKSLRTAWEHTPSLSTKLTEEAQGCALPQLTGGK